MNTKKQYCIACGSIHKRRIFFMSSPCPWGFFRCPRRVGALSHLPLTKIKKDFQEMFRKLQGSKHVGLVLLKLLWPIISRPN